jgi:hypothetical protein
LLNQLSVPLRDFVKDFKAHGAEALQQVRCSGRETRSHLQATRLNNFIRALPPKVRHTTKARLIARKHALAKQAIPFKSNRLDHKAQNIQSNYQVKATAYWR